MASESKFGKMIQYTLVYISKTRQKAMDVTYPMRKDDTLVLLNNTGSFKNNKACGYGYYVDEKGVIFEGLWDENCQCGLGIEEWNDNSYYRGQYLNGNKHGLGRSS